MLQYSAIDNAFKEDVFNSFPDYDAQRITGFLEDFLVKNNFSSGIELNFLFEAPP